MYQLHHLLKFVRRSSRPLLFPIPTGEVAFETDLVVLKLIELNGFRNLNKTSRGAD